MASLEQIGAALKAADAAGNVEDATRLASAYRAMQQGTAPPAAPPAAAPATPAPAPAQSVGDQLSAGFTSGVNAIPIAGPTILGGLERMKAAVQGRPYEDVAATDKAQTEANPVASTVGAVAGTTLPFVAGGMIPAVAKATGMAGPLIQRMAAGALSGAGIDAADTAARGGSPEDAAFGALQGGLVGGGVPVLGTIIKSVARGLKAPVMVAPPASALKADASIGYDAARATGATFKPGAFQVLKDDLTGVAKDAGVMLPSGKMAPGFGKIKGTFKALDEYAGSKEPISVPQQQTMRHVMENAADSSDKTERRVGTIMLKQFDQHFDNLPEAGFESGAGPQAMTSIANARGAYSQAMRTALVEELITKAQRAGGSAENFRTQFRGLLNSARKSRGFPPDQLAAIDSFVRGGSIGDLVSAFGTRVGGLPGAVVGSAAAGPVGGVLGAVAGPIMRKGAGRAAAGAAEAIRSRVAGAPEMTKLERIARALESANDNPSNLGIPPVAAALWASKRP